MKKIKYAVVGYGNRGQGYTDYCVHHPDEYEVVAIAEANEARREKAKKVGAPVYNGVDAFLEAKVEADIVCVATQDRQHKKHAIALMNAGYDLLLEKPISDNLEDCIAIYRTAKELNRKVIVCHVLRYTAFYSTIKRLLLQGAIGEPVNIQTGENIGYWHMAHSYVRGPWHNSEQASPILLAKCCHDLDIICWFLDKKCTGVNSVGSLTYFTPANKPQGAGDYCSDCPVKDACVYDAMKIYPTHPWCNLYYMTDEPTVENIRKNIRHTQYDRCVYSGDNDVCDHQSVVMQFEGGVVATHTLSAFSQKVYRKLHIQGTEGELWGTFDEESNLVEIRRFDGKKETVDTNRNIYEESPHGGGDASLMHETYKVLNGGVSMNITDIGQSILSHKIAFAAERSRANGGNTEKIS